MNTSLLTEVLKDVCVVTPGLLKSIGEDRESPVVQRAFREMTLVVGGLGETDDGAVVPGEDDGKEWRRRANGVADDVSKEGGLCQACILGGSRIMGHGSGIDTHTGVNRMADCLSGEITSVVVLVPGGVDSGTNGDVPFSLTHQTICITFRDLNCLSTPLIRE
jgi:hypothetical protein